jgi:hypothetical protein
MNTIDNITFIGSTLNYCHTKNHHGRSFTFTIINPGDAYGRNMCFINQKEAMVEVWDTTETRTTQMVSRYYISTLLGFDKWSNGKAFENGLCLDGGVPVWNINASDLTHVHQWLLQIAESLGIKPEAN